MFETNLNQSQQRFLAIVSALKSPLWTLTHNIVDDKLVIYLYTYANKFFSGKLLIATITLDEKESFITIHFEDKHISIAQKDLFKCNLRLRQSLPIRTV